MKIYSLSSLLLTSTLALSQPTLKLSTSQLKPETRYELIFDHAVVNADQLNKPLENTYLVTSPALPGTLTWTARNVAHFHPQQAPRLGTKYSFSTASGLVHLDGSEIPTIALGEKSTPNFENNYHRRTAKENNRQPVSYVRYNDNISPEQVATKFYYINKAGTAVPATVSQAKWSDLDSSYYVKPSWGERFENTLKRRQGIELANNQHLINTDTAIKNALIITPTSLLSVGEDWTLIAKKNLPNADNTAHTTEETNHFIWDIHAFTVNRISPVIYADQPRSIHINFTGNLPKELNEERLREHIAISPDPGKISYKRHTDNTLKILGDFTSRDTWNVSASKGIEAQNKLLLGVDTAKEITFKHVPSGVSLPAFDTAQLSKGDRRFSIDTVNMREVRVQVKMLNNEQVIRATQGYRHYSGDGPDYEQFPAKAALPFELITGTTVYDKVMQLDNAIDTSKTIKFSWDDILPNAQRDATFFLSVTGKPKNEVGKKEAHIRRAQSIVQLTNIGLAWKISNAQTWVYAYSLETGEPLGNVAISTYGEDAKKLGTATTDSNGLATVENSEDDRHLIASLGGDQFTVTFDNSLSTVSMWRFPVKFSWSEQVGWDRKMMLFTDRNLYRPADTVRVKGILRERHDNELRASDATKVTVRLRDQRNKEISSKEVEVSSNGSFDHSFTLPAGIVGRFYISCFIAKDDQHAASTFTHGFNVQEFRRNAFEIKADLQAPEIAGTQTKLELKADYYQGTPVAKGTVKWYASASQVGFYPEKFRDYYFGDHRTNDSYYWSHYFGYGSANRYRDTQHSHGTMPLSADGTATVISNIPKCEFPTPQHISIDTEVTDSRDQTLISTSGTTYFPTALYFGIARTDGLVRVGDSQSLNLVAVDIDGNYSKASHTATVEIQREYYDTIKIQAADGSVRTTNEKRTEDLGTSTAEINPGKPTLVDFKPTKAGRYLITLRGTDSEGRKTATASSIYVYGSDDYPWATEDGIRIKLVAEQKSYKPGDTARLLVMTPIEGTALVTVERKGVLKSYRRELTADKPVIEIPVEKQFAPNAYVSVLVMRGTQDSTRKHKQPALKLGYCELTVDDATQRLVVKIDKPSTTILPGQNALVSGTITDSNGDPVDAAEVTFFAEDEGTLAVAGFETPDPFKFFNSRLALSLRTGVSLSYFLEEDPEQRFMGNKGFTIGGGDGAFASSAVSIKNRINFDPCAAWIPAIETDINGRFTASFKTPDTLTRYRLMAIATKGADRFGSDESSLVVKKDLMLEPKPPRFANEGDSLKTRVLVENTSQYSGEWAVTLQVDSMCAIPGSTENFLTKTVSLSAGESDTLTFPTNFINTGETSWTWTAAPNALSGTQLTEALRKQLSDRIVNTFEVTYPRPLLRQSEFAGINSGDTANLVANMAPVIMSGRGHMELEFSNSLLLEAGGATKYLLHYPYGCLEQTASSLMPWFAVRDLKGIVPGFENYTEENVQEALQKGVNHLLTMQTPDGGLAYWPGGERSQDWASSYGGMALLLAKKHGAEVPQNALDRLTAHLQQFVRTKVKTSENNRWHRDSRARALYVLALANSADIASQNTLYEQRDGLDSDGRSLLALAIHHSGGSKEMCLSLLEAPTIKTESQHWMRYRSDSATRLLALSTIQPNDSRTLACMRELLDSRNQQGHWHTTWANGWALHAMAAYARYVETDRADLVLLELETSAGKRSIKLTKENPVVSLKLQLEEAQSLIVRSNGKAYSRVLASSKPTLAPISPTSSNGITISRRYERVNERGETSPLGQPNVGDLIKITLDVGLTDNLAFIAIDDPLPSIFESINEDFASQSSAHSGSTRRNYSITHSEFRSERTLFFLNKSWASGKQSISYLARVTAAGSVHAPPAKVEAMYNPSDYALSESHTLTTTTPEAAAGR